MSVLLGVQTLPGVPEENRIIPRRAANFNTPGELSPTVASPAGDIYNRSQWENGHIFIHTCDFTWVGASGR